MKLSLFAVSALALAIGFSAHAENLNQTLECQKTLTSSVVDQYYPESGYVICDGTKKQCFLTYKDGSSFQFKLSEQPTFIANEIYLDMTDARQKIEHRLTTFTEPKSGNKIFIDVFWGENNRAFTRNLTQVNPAGFEAVTLTKTDSKQIRTLAKASIDTQMDLVKGNAEKKSGPPGWTMEQKKESWTNRIAGCDWHKATAQIKRTVAGIE